MNRRRPVLPLPTVELDCFWPLDTAVIEPEQHWCVCCGDGLPCACSRTASGLLAKGRRTA